VGVDASHAMLDQTRRRASARGWSNVATVVGGARRPCALTDGPFDAVLFTYSLAVIDDWIPAWRQALTLLRAGGRIAVADTAVPVGRWRALSPLARLALLGATVAPSPEDTVTDRALDDDVEQLHNLADFVRR